MSSVPRRSGPLSPGAELGEWGLAVVVPVRNEQEYLPRCLTALTVARRRLPSDWRLRTRVEVVVVLDRCTDRSAEILARCPDITAVLLDAGLVGVARATGVARAIRNLGIAAENLWIACTDGDSAVPADWLTTHLRHARSGTELLLGMVTPDSREVETPTLKAWQGLHPGGEGHPHVFGANLGVRGDTYLRAGGFAPVATGEDHLLVQAVRRRQGRIVATGESPVLTSGRRSGRAPAGFADYLKDLSAIDRVARLASVRTR